MRSFKILFYESRMGELVKVKEFFRLAEQISDLVQNPPPEFFEMLESSMPMHGWAEIDEERATVFVIFVPRGGELKEVDRKDFVDWLQKVKPGDFKSLG
jgi:hypothetical protein